MYRKGKSATLHLLYVTTRITFIQKKTLRNRALSVPEDTKKQLEQKIAKITKIQRLSEPSGVRLFEFELFSMEGGCPYARGGSSRWPFISVVFVIFAIFCEMILLRSRHWLCTKRDLRTVVAVARENS